MLQDGSWWCCHLGIGPVKMRNRRQTVFAVADAFLGGACPPFQKECILSYGISIYFHIYIYIQVYIYIHIYTYIHMYINEMDVSRDPRWCTSFAQSFFLWLRNPPDFSCGFSAHDGPLMVVLTLIFEMTTTINVPGIPLTTQFCHSVFDSSALH